MTETEAQAARRLERMSEELHIDAALHSDPCAHRAAAACPGN